MNPTLSMRALSACRRYAAIDVRIKRIGRLLGGDRCLNWAPYRPTLGRGSTVVLDGIELEVSGHVCCLDRLYDYRKRSGWNPPRYIAEEEPSLCMYCREKDELIQERKQLRQKLGAVKREIIRIGGKQ